MSAGSDSIWFSTRSALFEGGEGAWSAAAEYAGPLGRLLARRYPWLQEADRADLVQDTLIEIKETLAAGHDPARGRFRALLQTVLRRRVADRLRRRRAAALDAVPEPLAPPDAAEIEALDLEAALVDALTSARDRFTQGPARDLDVLYALADRIVHGRSNAEIAARSGASADRVARLLERGRDAIFERLLAREAGIAGGPALERAVATFKACLRRPGEALRALAGVPDAAARAALEHFLDRFRAALPPLGAAGSARAGELRRGLELIVGAGEGGPP